MDYPVIIGGSAGSFRILSRIIPLAEKGFRFPMIICVHRLRKDSDTFLPALKGNHRVHIKEAENQEKLVPGIIYVCPANKHLLLDKGRFLLSSEAPVNYSRPSIDVTMKSGAKMYGKELLGILLTGANTDGVEGMKAIHDAGGITVVQDPDDAEVAVMPRAAVDSFPPSHILPADKIINFIQNLIHFHEDT
jgi:two-component system chemotaxis response regulator CheB